MVQIALEVHNTLNDSYWDLDSARRIYSNTNIPNAFSKDNPSNCDNGSIKQGPIKKLTRQ